MKLLATKIGQNLYVNTEGFHGASHCIIATASYPSDAGAI